MKYLPTILLVILASVFASHDLSAQDRSSYRTEQKIELLKNNLGISDEVAVKVIMVMDTYSKKKHELLFERTKTDEVSMTELTGLVETRQRELKALLTPEQLQKFQPRYILQENNDPNRLTGPIEENSK